LIICLEIRVERYASYLFGPPGRTSCLQQSECFASFDANAFTVVVRLKLALPVSSEILDPSGFSAMGIDLQQICRTGAPCRAMPPKMRYKISC
jgi:hypothetical protein